MSQPVNFHTRITGCVLFKLKCRSCYQNSCCYKTFSENPKKKLKYPPAHRDETFFDDYHGTQVPDPYRWLEEPDTKPVKSFIKKQNKLFHSYISRCTEREYMEKRISDLLDFPKYSCPFKRGKYYFFFKTRGLDAETCN